VLLSITGPPLTKITKPQDYKVKYIAKHQHKTDLSKPFKKTTHGLKNFFPKKVDTKTPPQTNREKQNYLSNKKEKTGSPRRPTTHFLRDPKE
jgi:hypothetical protein